MSDFSENLIIWNSVKGCWECPFCGHNTFYQTVLAENVISIKTHKGLLVEGSDFAGSWSILERKTVCCAACNNRVNLPLTEDIFAR